MVVTVLPPVTEVRGFSTPEESIRSWIASEDGKASAKLNNAVAGSMIRSCLERDTFVILTLDGGARLEVEARGEKCVLSVNMKEGAAIAGAAQTLGEVVDVVWPGEIGRTQWRRLSILTGVIGYRIKAIGLHVFGASMHLSNSTILEFSAMNVVERADPVLYWDLMKHRRACDGEHDAVGSGPP